MIAGLLLMAAMSTNSAPLPIERANWIAAPDSPTMPLFRSKVDLARPIKRATVQVCGLGAFELRVNGRKIGDRFMDPGWTNYRKSCPFVAFDVTRCLREGENALGVMLGNGFFNVVGGRYLKYRGSFGAPRLRLALSVEFDDGTKAEWLTGEDWKCHDGPITFSCIYGGEDFDARNEPEGWDKPGFDDSRWAHSRVQESLGERMVPQSWPPMRVKATFKPIRTTQPAPGVWVFDLGQNASGIPAIKVKGPRGATVKITPAELLNRQGLADQGSSGGPVSFSYSLNGKGSEAWQPRFTYYGFRYLQIEGAVPAGEPNPDGLPVLLEVKGLHTRSDCREVGSFECSNNLFNRIHTLIGWAMRSNLQSVLTDCPHREKLGWLEQTHLMGSSLMFNFDLKEMWRKVACDMAEAQLDDGLVPDIAPEYTVFEGGFRDSPEWGSACVLVPWQAYRWYGDLEILRENYPMMRRYVEYLRSKAKDGIVDHGLGDWYDFGPGAPGFAQLTPIAFTATAFYFHDLVVLDQVARAIGAPERYADRAAEVREAFNRRFYHSDGRAPLARRHDTSDAYSSTTSYADGSQCANAMALAMGLAPADRRDEVLENLVEDVRAHGNHLTAGDVGYRYLLRALAEGGRSDVIWEMATQKTAPSYADQLAKGATALTEAWDAGRASSQNHFMLGHIEEWFYHDLAGIRQADDSAGFKKVLIEPQIVGDVKWVKASYRSAAGLIVSNWRVGKGKLTMEVTIPRGSRAVVRVPATEVAQPAVAKVLGGGRFEVGAGRWVFSGLFPLPRLRGPRG